MFTPGMASSIKGHGYIIISSTYIYIIQMGLFRLVFSRTTFLDKTATLGRAYTKVSTRMVPEPLTRSAHIPKYEKYHIYIYICIRTRTE